MSNYYYEKTEITKEDFYDPKNMYMNEIYNDGIYTIYEFSSCGFKWFSVIDELKQATTLYGRLPEFCKPEYQKNSVGGFRGL